MPSEASGLMSPPGRSRVLLRQLKFSQRSSRDALIQRKQLGRPRIFVSGSHNRCDHRASQPSQDDAPGYSVMSFAGAYEEVVGTPRCSREVSLGLAWKQRFTRNKLMPAGRAIGIGVGPCGDRANRIAIELHIARA